ncbi:MAG TPA: hypothetical protein DEH25_12490 [Chloroflexi bacterium]|nr:hypothetical protein [Chloroflexota bacterium]
MYEPKIIAFLCTWCSYTGADLAGTARLKTPHNLRAIRVPCSGRVSPELVMKAFAEGADGVLVLGCHIGECHYDTGNHRAAKRMPILQALLEFVGLEPQRLRLDWVSASEGERFARIVAEFVEGVRDLGPIQWRVESRFWEIKKFESFEFENQRITPVCQSHHYAAATASLRDHARQVLTTGTASCVIGYEVGPRGITRPAFISDPAEVDRLVWNQACTHNLITYLKQKLAAESGKRVAIVVKPCDSRTINVLLAENRFTREQVYLIGMACEGIREGAGFGKVEDHYQARCLACTEHIPMVSDTLIGEMVSQPGHDLAHPFSSISHLQSLSATDRIEFWLNQFDRCIRCYACRQTCPICDCPTCLYESDDSLWVGMNIAINEKRTFHLGRAYHLAGRCVGCNECERVCPMEIPISLLNIKLAQEVEAAFGYRAGLTVAPSPITTILLEEAKA